MVTCWDFLMACNLVAMLVVKMAASWDGLKVDVRV